MHARDLCCRWLIEEVAVACKSSSLHIIAKKKRVLIIIQCHFGFIQTLEESSYINLIITHSNANRVAILSHIYASHIAAQHIVICSIYIYVYTISGRVY